MGMEPFVKEIVGSTEYQSLLKPPKTYGLHSGRIYLKPAADCGQHNTGAQEEMLVFLSGNGQAVIGDKTFQVGVGKTLIINPGEATDWVCGKGNLVILDLDSLKITEFEL